MQQFDLTSIRRRLAPLGVLRSAINLGNTLLVSGRDEAGAPTGLAPSVARSLAARLKIPIALTPFASPGEIADRADGDVWDVALIGSEHARNGSIAFTPPYALIEATYLVLAESRLSAISDVDAPGIRVGAPARTAYGSLAREEPGAGNPRARGWDRSGRKPARTPRDRGARRASALARRRQRQLSRRRRAARQVHRDRASGRLPHGRSGSRGFSRLFRRRGQSLRPHRSPDGSACRERCHRGCSGLRRLTPNAFRSGLEEFAHQRAESSGTVDLQRVPGAG